MRTRVCLKCARFCPLTVEVHHSFEGHWSLRFSTECCGYEMVSLAGGCCPENALWSPGRRLVEFAEDMLVATDAIEEANGSCDIAMRLIEKWLPEHPVLPQMVHSIPRGQVVRQVVEMIS
jgi:hypothetical protein